MGAVSRGGRLEKSKCTAAAAGEKQKSKCTAVAAALQEQMVATMQENDRERVIVSRSGSVDPLT